MNNKKLLIKNQAMESQCASDGHGAVVRMSAGYHPTVWGDYFILHDNHISLQEKSNTEIKRRIEELKEEVRRLLMDATLHDILQAMDLVDSLQLLGLEYHFDKEINEALSRIHDAEIKCDYSPYYAALRFRLLRQHGRYVSADVFDELREDKGNFLSTLNDDVEGLLSLHNAAYLGIHGETALDELISFTRGRLSSMLSDLEPTLAAKARFVLDTPLHRRPRRLLAREYIPIYQQESRKKDVLLELAKLDFNLLQSLFREEVKNASIWWNDMDFRSCFPFARDRLVECYYWAVETSFEPHHSLSRIITTKLLCLLTILDDIYDVYGTLEECQLLTEIIQRWETRDADQLNIKYMKDYYLKLIHTFDEIENTLEPDEKYRMHYLKEEFKALSRCYLEEKKWAAGHHIPTLEEHLQVSLVTSAYSTLECGFFVGMGKEVTREMLECLCNYPTIVKASQIICRIVNDITADEVEKTMQQVASTVECYMKEYGTDEKMACEKLQLLVEDAWKDITKEYITPTVPFHVSLLEIILNFSRVIDLVYSHSDRYSNSATKLKDQIYLVLADPVPV